ncbi:putative bifunctional diguanylate cyclase/phosphodiesterase [Sapientia aquatica]|uniref:EAL domain-containing protein n=1 Tax=Sapientia aquatica TaxID=1549640 RepID=A0A4V3AUY6_9BURK|nr:EAL domain-containing protein [Sapientia aquatica]TDK67238.1 EAL domain-containing protein [Sapientia aquatica]
MPSDFPSTKSVSTAGMVLQRNRLIQIILAILCAVGCVILINFVNQNWPTVWMLLVLSACMLVALILARANRITLAAMFTVITLTIVMGLMSFAFDGIYDATISAFPAILVFAAMFATLRLFVGLLTFIILILSTVVWVNITGVHVNVVAPVSIMSLVNVVAILMATAFFVWKLASDLRIAVARLETENERIRDALTHIDTLAHNDALTGLPNRLLARARFEQAVELAKRGNDKIALLYLDLDNFKTINDSLGHIAGDQLLCEVATRLKQTIRASDTASRQGGDEFLVIVAGQAEQESVATVAVKIIDLLSEYFSVNGMEISVTCSLGISMYPDDGQDFDALLKHADIAMYQAKERGRNGFQFYDPQMNTNVVEHLHLISGIRTALQKDEFKLYYQPQFDLKSERIIGAEALIRWKNPELGMIPPNKFIPVAERSGQIHEIGAWVIDEACRQAREWMDAGLPPIVVGVNLSPIQFRRDNVERDVMNALEHYNLPPSAIELELTESLLIVESDQISPLLKRLRNLGVHLSIDDFGTGYSNLGYLSRFEVERLKIDQSFIRRMLENKNDEGIVRAIIEMAHSLGLEVVAEGVETAEMLVHLKGLGCEFGQGYLWSPALPAAEFVEFIRTYQPK